MLNNLRCVIVVLVLFSIISTIGKVSYAGDEGQDYNFRSIPGFTYYCGGVGRQENDQYSIIDCYNNELKFERLQSIAVRVDKGGPPFDCMCHDHYWYCDGKILDVNGALLKISCTIEEGEIVELKLIENTGQ